MYINIGSHDCEYKVWYKAKRGEFAADLIFFKKFATCDLWMFTINANNTILTHVEAHGIFGLTEAAICNIKEAEMLECSILKHKPYMEEEGRYQFTLPHRLSISPLSRKHPWRIKPGDIEVGEEYFKAIRAKLWT